MAIERPPFIFKEQKGLSDEYKIIVFDEDEKIGELDGWKRENCPRFYLYLLKVHESYRKRGIGTTLLNMAESFSKKRNLQRIELDISSDNPEDVTTMIAFFQSHGYFVNSPSPLPCFAFKMLKPESEA